MKVLFAYDGSINGDWVAKYAIRLAANSETRTLTVVSVQKNTPPPRYLTEKINRITSIAADRKVTLDVKLINAKSVFEGVISALEDPAGTLIVCSVRTRGNARGYLYETAAFQLMKHPELNTVAFRIVQPGILGSPHNILLPVAGRPSGIAGGVSLLHQMGSTVRQCRVLHAVSVSPRHYLRLTATEMTNLRLHGESLVAAVGRHLSQQLNNPSIRIDTAVRVSEDWVREVIVDACSYKSDLIIVEAAGASLRTALRRDDPIERLLHETPCDIAIHRRGD
tara:strand:+ start:81280 stop:82119 length:840 start_codon:yes stop_codon:yes gene_type:complete